MCRRIVICLLLLGGLLTLPFYFRSDEKLAPPEDGCDVVVVISAHNKNIRDEYERAFRKHYRARYGKDVRIDFRSPGGTSDISRYIKGEGRKEDYTPISPKERQLELFMLGLRMTEGVVYNGEFPEKVNPLLER